jgi:hypothetical protein
MKNKLKFCARFLCFFILLLTPLLFSQEQLDELRITQPVIISAESIPEYLDYPVNEIIAFHFDISTDTWHQIQLQIDETGPEIRPNFYDAL